MIKEASVSLTFAVGGSVVTLSGSEDYVSGTVLADAFQFTDQASLTFLDGGANADNAIGPAGVLAMSVPGTARIGFAGQLSNAGLISVSGAGSSLNLSGAVSGAPGMGDGSAIFTNTGDIEVSDGATLAMSMVSSDLILMNGPGGTTMSQAHGATVQSGDITVNGGTLQISAGPFSPGANPNDTYGFDLTGAVSVTNGTLLVDAAVTSTMATAGAGIALTNTVAEFTQSARQGSSSGITLAGANTLILDQPVAFTESIAGIAAGDTIDLRNVIVSRVVGQSGGLALMSGASSTPVMALNLSSPSSILDVRLASDSLGGTLLQFVTPPSMMAIAADPTTNERIATVGGAHTNFSFSQSGAAITVTGATDTVVLNGASAVRFDDGITYFNNADDAARVYRLAMALLGQAPDAVNAGRWVAGLGNGQSTLTTIADEILQSDAYKAVDAGSDNAGYLARLYNNAVGHAADATTQTSNLQKLAAGTLTRAQIAAALADSPEALGQSATAIGTNGVFVATYLPASTHVASSHNTSTISVTGHNTVTVQSGGTTQVTYNSSTVGFTDGVARIDSTGNAEIVAHIYKAAFNRNADLNGLNYWADLLDTGRAQPVDVADNFSQSAEFQSSYGPLSDTQYVDQLYQNVLGRAADGGGEQFWVSAMSAGMARGQVLLGFAESFENIHATIGTIGDLNEGKAYRLYQAALDHAPDDAGLAYWTGQLQHGMAEADVAQAFLQSPEFSARYGGLNDTDFVDRLYQNVLGRSADAAGETYWTAQMNGGVSRAGVLTGFSDSPENRNATAASTHDGWVFLAQ